MYFNQINLRFVSVRDFFQKHNTKSYRPQTDHVWHNNQCCFCFCDRWCYTNKHEHSWSEEAVCITSTPSHPLEVQPFSPQSQTPSAHLGEMIHAFLCPPSQTETLPLPLGALSFFCYERCPTNLISQNFHQYVALMSDIPLAQTSVLWTIKSLIYNNISGHIICPSLLQKTNHETSSKIFLFCVVIPIVTRQKET